MNKSRRFVERHNETSDQKSSNKKENGENEIEYSEDSTSNEKNFWLAKSVLGVKNWVAAGKDVELRMDWRGREYNKELQDDGDGDDVDHHILEGSQAHDRKDDGVVAVPHQGDDRGDEDVRKWRILCITRGEQGYKTSDKTTLWKTEEEHDWEVNEVPEVGVDV